MDEGEKNDKNQGGVEGGISFCSFASLDVPVTLLLTRNSHTYTHTHPCERRVNTRSPSNQQPFTNSDKERRSICFLPLSSFLFTFFPSHSLSLFLSLALSTFHSSLGHQCKVTYSLEYASIDQVFFQIVLRKTFHSIVIIACDFHCVNNNDAIV